MCSSDLKAVSPGMLPPLGIVFGLFVAFIAAQVWNDNERAEAAVNREASALRTAVVLSSDFAEAGERLRRLIRAHIKETIVEEWPKLAHQSATLSFTPPFLAQALQLTLSLTPDNDGQASRNARSRRRSAMRSTRACSASSSAARRSMR